MVSQHHGCALCLGTSPLYSAISSLSALLHSITVYTCSLIVDYRSINRSCSPVEVHVFNVESVKMTRDVAEKSETDVYEYVHAAACDHEDTNGRDKDGDEDDEEGWECGIIWRHVNCSSRVEEVGIIGRRYCR